MSRMVEMRIERSLRWLSLSMAARGVVVEVLAEMQRHGRVELALPPIGLEAVASLCGRPWTEVGPALEELFAFGYLRFDASRRTLVDENPASPRASKEALAASPSPAARWAEACTPCSTTREIDDGESLLEASASAAASRSLSNTPSAIRGRARRLREKAAREAAARAQLGLFATDANADRTRATAVANVDGGRMGNAERSPAFANAPSLSLSSSYSSPRKERVALDPDAMPNGWAEHAAKLRPDLPAATIERSWRRFALAKAEAFTSFPIAQSRWEGWLERERVMAIVDRDTKPAKGDTAPAPYHRVTASRREPAPASRPRPMAAPSAASWVHEALPALGAAS